MFMLQVVKLLPTLLLIGAIVWILQLRKFSL